MSQPYTLDCLNNYGAMDSGSNLFLGMYALDLKVSMSERTVLYSIQTILILLWDRPNFITPIPTIYFPMRHMRGGGVGTPFSSVMSGLTKRGKLFVFLNVNNVKKIH